MTGNAPFYATFWSRLQVRLEYLESIAERMSEAFMGRKHLDDWSSFYTEAMSMVLMHIQLPWHTH
jgi:hypothetical protein